MPYLGRQGQFGIRQRFQYLASNGDTSVSGADANGITMTFSDGLYIDVFLNGIKLKAGEDYNTTTANTVAGISAMNANDEIEVIAYDTFSAVDTVSASDGGTFSGAVTFNGDINVGDDLSLNSDSAILNFGTDSDVTLTHVADTGLLLNSTRQLQFNDASQNITAPNGTTLDINATDEIELNATLVDINANVEVSGTLSTGGTVSIGGIINGASDTNTSIDFEGSDVITFNTGGSESMRITSSQDVFIGVTSFGDAPGFTFDVSAGSLTHAVSSGAARTMTSFKNGGSAVGEIRTSTTATQFLTSSDYRLKENVTSITDGIVRVKQLKPYRFNFITDGSTTLDGFLAHEMQTVVPESVSGTKDEKESDGVTIKPQGIDQAKLVPLLTAALQEAITKIESLESRVTALET
tara:strand:- start:1425 stop:2651 length:1227 start_codon:yes stop_codon:yes gene_type:complete